MPHVCCLACHRSPHHGSSPILCDFRAKGRYTIHTLATYLMYASFRHAHMQLGSLPIHEAGRSSTFGTTHTPPLVPNFWAGFPSPGGQGQGKQSWEGSCLKQAEHKGNSGESKVNSGRATQSIFSHSILSSVTAAIDACWILGQRARACTRQAGRAGGVHACAKVDESPS